MSGELFYPVENELKDFRTEAVALAWWPSIRVAALGLLLLIVSYPASGQDHQSRLRLQPGQLLESHFHRAYGTEDGLPSGWVEVLLQSRDGFIWVGTHNGLARFDGTRFTVFDVRNTPEIRANSVRELYESRDGSLWIGTLLGLTRYSPGRPGHFEAIEEFDGLEVRAVLEDRSGRLWVGTRAGLWSAQVGMGFEKVPGAPDNLHVLAEDEQGTLWLGADLGLFRRDEEDYVRLTHHDWFPVQDLRVGEQGLWVSAPGGLRRYEQGRLQFVEEGEPRFGGGQDLVQSRDGTIYVTSLKGLARWNGTVLDVCPSALNPRALLEDREGGLWVGFLRGNGLHRYQNSLTGITLRGRHVLCAFEDRRGVLWFGTANGLVRLENGVYTNYNEEDGVPGYIWTIAEGDNGSLWIGGFQGLVRGVDGQFEWITDPPELVGAKIQSVFQDSRGTLWIGRRSNGTVILRDGGLTRLTQVEDGVAEWFWEDDEGQVWLGTRRRGIFRGTPDQLQRVVAPELDRLPPWGLDYHVTADGDLWLATLDGLARHRRGRFDVFTVRDGLAAGSIERLGADHHGNLWMGGRHGLYYVSRQELEEFAAGQRDSIESHVVEQHLGMSGTPATFGTPLAVKARDGTLYLTAPHGVVTVPPEPLAPAEPPGLSIDAVRLDGEIIDANSSLDFTSGRHRLSIEFSILSFSKPLDVRAWYRLDGWTDAWIEVGAERSVHFTDLSPGDYSFRLVAETGDGARSAEVPLDLRVNPRWWELLWVRLVGLVGLVALIGLYFRSRTRRVRRQNAELLREIADRKRAEEESRRHWDQLARVSRAVSMGEITTSIAHEVKQPLFAIVSNAQTAARFLDREEPDLEEVAEALSDIASDGNRAAVIIDHIRSLVSKEHAPLQEIDLNAVAREAIRLVDPEIRRRGLVLETEFCADLPRVMGDPIELQQVLINLMLNGAQAMEEEENGRLTVSTGAQNGNVIVAVTDCGVGLDEAQTQRLFEPFYTTKPRGTGMGLAMNRAIIQRHGGQIRAASNPGPGATFEFTLPVSEPMD